MNIDYKAVIAVGGVLLLFAYLAKKQAAAVAQSVNPVSDQNVFYKGAGAVTGAVTGSQLPLGTQIYDWLHPSQ